MSLLIKISIMSVFLTLSIYHLLVWIGRRDDYTNLIYSFYCIGFCLVIFFKQIYTDLKLKENNIIIYTGFIIGCHIVSGSILFFSNIIFELKKTKIGKFLDAYYLFLSIYALFLIILFNIIKKKLIILMYFPFLGLYGVIFLIFVFGYYIKNKQYKFFKSDYKNKQKTIVIIGLSYVMIFLIIATILNTFVIQIPFYVIYSSVIINTLIFAYAITDGFNNEHKALIKKEIELEKLNLTLEQKVHDRTKQLEKAKESIEQKEKQKTSFFINLAHETKTPLTLISNYLHKYINKTSPDEDLAIINSNVDKLQKDMVNFLDLEKLERCQVFYNHDQIIDLYRFLLDKIKIFKETAKNNSIKILPTLNKDIFIKIDPYALDRIINNILDNAVKYNKESGTIEIILKKNNKDAVITIKDTGIGISDDQIKNIFNPYYQLSHEKRNIQGIGMGLNIVKKILNQIKGKIIIDSKLDEGTAVLITIPVLENIENEKILNKYSEKKTKNNSNKKIKHDLNDVYDNNKRFSILIVEDNLDMLGFLKENLKDNYNIFLAKNGKEALDKLNSIPKQIDLIISDIMMDVMDGYEFYKNYINLDSINKSVPFIFLTAKAKHDEKIKGLKLGAVDYIYKPFDINELRAKIESHLGLNEAKNMYLFIMQDEILNNNLEHWFYRKYNITDKEKDIIKLLLDGKLNKEIADILGYAEGTVRNYTLEIYKKTGTVNKIELFKKVIKMR